MHIRKRTILTISSRAAIRGYRKTLHGKTKSLFHCSPSISHTHSDSFRNPPKDTMWYALVQFQFRNSQSMEKERKIYLSVCVFVCPIPLQFMIHKVAQRYPPLAKTTKILGKWVTEKKCKYIESKPRVLACQLMSRVSVWSSEVVLVAHLNLLQWNSASHLSSSRNSLLQQTRRLIDLEKGLGIWLRSYR